MYIYNNMSFVNVLIHINLRDMMMVQVKGDTRK